MAKFVFLYRKSADPSEQPSPAEMQAGYLQWKNWMGKYSKEILEQSPPRSGPKPGGAVAVCRGGAVTDGPYVEGKEVVGGWSFIEAESLPRAIEIAKEVPMFASVEIIELQTF
ncbi:MAG TPA: YciI family protein [Polyangiaceae bacterium]|nr:YciI family protein [Polyangiaceae bacterium]